MRARVKGKTRTTAILLSAGLCAGLTLGAAACRPPAPEGEGGEGAMGAQAAVDTAAIMAAVDSLRSAYEEAVAAGDFAAQAAAYTPDAMYSPPGEPPIQGTDAIRAALEQGTPPGATIEIQPMDTGILGPDWVYEFGTGTFSFTPEGAAEPASMTSTYLVLLHRTAEGWRIHRESLSSNAPPPESP